MRTDQLTPGPARISLVHQFLETSAARDPGKTAVVHEGSRVSYGDVNAWADRLALGLAAAGVKPGDRVVLLSENSVAYVVSYYGILKSGAVVASLQTDIRPDALAGLVRELEPKAVLVSKKLEGTVRALEAVLLRGVTVMV
ncbi:MAG TPA: AMP-binding protein, partial [Acidobacteriota bacterium]|nr:AMP-binding protein [Acidobacteriota bacterium]